MKSKVSTQRRIVIEASSADGKSIDSNLSVPLSEMLTAKELEAVLKIDQKTIYRYVACGLIPYVRIQSNIRFIKWQIAKWVEEQTYLPKSFNKSDR